LLADKDNVDESDDEEEKVSVELTPEARPPYKMNVTWVNDGRKY